jgi:hypothetical protein
MGADDDGSGQGPVFRSKPDTTRPTISTAVAATRFGRSRYHVAELVRQGKLEGFGVRSQDGGRTRWYVFADALPHEPGSRLKRGDGLRTSIGASKLLKYLLEARNNARCARDERDNAQRLLLDCADTVNEALRAVQRGDQGRSQELLLTLHAIRTNVQRRLLDAEQHEAKAQACLDVALQSLLPPGEGVESHEWDDAASAFRAESTARGSREPCIPE